MTGMERFTQRARSVARIAEEEAQKLGCPFIGSEHILLGLIQEEGGVAKRALKELGVNIDEARQIVDDLIPKTEKGKKVDNVSFGTSANELVDLSLEQSKQSGHHYIGTEHILLALIEQKKKPGKQSSSTNRFEDGRCSR